MSVIAEVSGNRATVVVQEVADDDLAARRDDTARICLAESASSARNEDDLVCEIYDVSSLLWCFLLPDRLPERVG